MDAHDHPEHAPKFQAYINVFVALMIFTLASFGAYKILGQGPSSMWIILAISVAKATLVALIFMHLKFDWPNLYCIVIPVCVMAVMVMIVLLPDIVLSWRQ
ncbi:MAG: cytochrome C oxidase subunit IV family protein [Gemmataceae bacterium]|nr:cytochrome C oxidase subunit IV family protein [Gemmataceae bacterium]